MSWAENANMGRDRMIGVLKDESADYYRKSDPGTAIPVRVIYSTMQENKELGDLQVGTYQASPHAFLDLAELGFTPVRGDTLYLRGEIVTVYEVLKDGEGGVTVNLGDYRG